MTTEHAELKTVSFSVDDVEDTRGDNVVPSVVPYTPTGEFELKRLGGIRDPEYHRDLQHGRKIIWKEDKGVWEYNDQNTPGGFDTVVESTTEVYLTISMVQFTVTEQSTVKHSSCVTPHHRF